MAPQDEITTLRADLRSAHDRLARVEWALLEARRDAEMQRMRADEADRMRRAER